MSKGVVFVHEDGATFEMVPLQVFICGSQTVIRIGRNALFFDKDGKFDGSESSVAGFAPDSPEAALLREAFGSPRPTPTPLDARTTSGCVVAVSVAKSNRRDGDAIDRRPAEQLDLEPAVLALHLLRPVAVAQLRLPVPGPHLLLSPVTLGIMLCFLAPVLVDLKDRPLDPFAVHQPFVATVAVARRCHLFTHVAHVISSFLAFLIDRRHDR